MIEQLSSEQLKTLNEQGFLVVPRHTPYAALEEARQAAGRIVDKCIKNKYPFCRAEHRLSDKFIEKIDNIFSPELFEPELLKLVVESPIVNYAKTILNDEDIYLAFQRLHPSRKYSIWSNWHRDAVPGDFGTLKITIPLFNEVGFHVIPGSHKAGNKQLDNGTCDTTIRGHQKDEARVPVKAGDILIFYSSILHRASCPGGKKYQRAHLHFNFIKMSQKEQNGQIKQDFLTKDYLTSRIPQEWKELLAKAVPPTYPITTPHEKITVGGRLKRGVSLSYYYLSALLPFKITQHSPQWLVPYCRCPKEYQSYFSELLIEK